jgi:hypothetical protein
MKFTYRVAIASLLSSVFITAVGFGFDRVLLREGVPRIGVLLLSNLLTGLVAGALLLQNKVRAQEKQRLLQQRLQKIFEMNHHVRNALQVVAFYQYQMDDPRAAQLIRESIQRIEWTLEEVLPRGWGIGGIRTQRSINATLRTEENAEERL